MPSGSSGMYVFSIWREDGLDLIPFSISSLKMSLIFSTVSFVKYKPLSSLSIWKRLFYIIIYKISFSFPHEIVFVISIAEFDGKANKALESLTSLSEY